MSLDENKGQQGWQPLIAERNLVDEAHEESVITKEVLLQYGEKTMDTLKHENPPLFYQIEEECKLCGMALTAEDYIKNVSTINNELVDAKNHKAEKAAQRMDESDTTKGLINDNPSLNELFQVLAAAGDKQSESIECADPSPPPPTPAVEEIYERHQHQEAAK